MSEPTQTNRKKSRLVGGLLTRLIRELKLS
jgi:hypothetical protein